jgi:hypothetical protein
MSLRKYLQRLRQRMTVGSTDRRHKKSRRPEVECLEGRTLPAFGSLFTNIVWLNEGSPGSDTDNFAATYGAANAAAARAVVEQAINAWELAISDFNYAGANIILNSPLPPGRAAPPGVIQVPTVAGEALVLEDNTYALTISAADLGGSAAKGFGRGSTSILGTDGAGKPYYAAITLDDDGGNAGGWYYDPQQPDDNAEFTSLTTRYRATNPTTNLPDLYRTIVHEIGHAMGIDQGNAADGNSLAINSLLTATGGTDQVDKASALYTFKGATTTATITANGGGHVYENTNPNDLMNAGRSIPNNGCVRELITPLDLGILADAYGYTTSGQLANFLINPNRATGALTLNDDPQLASNTITIDYQGTPQALTVTVDGYSQTYDSDSAPVASSITVNAGSGSDTVNVHGIPAGVAVTVNVGAGDTVNVGGSAGPLFGTLFTLNGIQGGVTVNGAGRLFIKDNSTLDPPHYYTIADGSVSRDGAAAISFSGPAVSVSTNTTDDTITFASPGGSPAVVVQTIVRDDVNDNLATARNTALTVIPENHFTFDGHIGNSPSFGTDVDMYRFYAGAGTFTADPRAFLTRTPYLRLFDSDGHELAHNFMGVGASSIESSGLIVIPPILNPLDPAAILTADLPADGTYYLGVSSRSNTDYDPVDGGGSAKRDFPTGDYHLDVSFALPSPPVYSTISQAVLLGNGSDLTQGADFHVYGAAIGNAGPGAEDVDMYRFSLASAAQVAASTATPDGGLHVDTWLRIFDALGHEVDPVGNPAAHFNGLQVTLPAGTYYLGVSGPGDRHYDPNVAGSGVVSGFGDYDLSLTLNAPPSLADIPDQPMTGWSSAATYTLTLPDGSGPITAATAAGTAFALRSRYGLFSDGNLWFDWGGRRDKWLQGAAGTWYIILPDGSFYLWDHSPQATGRLIAVIDPTYYADPFLLSDATPGAAVSFSGNQLTVTPEPGFSGPLDVTVTTGTGAAAVTTTFHLDVAPPPASSLAVPVSASDPNSAALTVSAAVESQAYQLRQQYGFFSDGNLWLNWGGRQEKWFQGAGQTWFFILSDGSLYQWDGSSHATGPLVATLDSGYYFEPARLYDATRGATVSTDGNQVTVTPDANFSGQLTVTVTVSDGQSTDSKSFTVTVAAAAPDNHPPLLAPIADQVLTAGQTSLVVTLSAQDQDGDPISYGATVESEAYRLKRQYGFYSDGDLWYDWGHRQEKWFQGALGAWFFITADGSVYQWDGSHQATGTQLAVLQSAYYADPSRLYNATRGATVDVSGGQLTVTPDAGFVGKLFVTVSASDGRATDVRSFTVTVG